MKALVTCIALLTIYVLSTGTASADTWTQLADLPTARFDAGVCAVDGKIYVIGGYRSWEGRQSKIEVYDPSSDSWSIKNNMPESASGLDACVIEGKIYLFYIDGSVKVYDPADETWKEKTPMQDARMDFGTCQSDGKIYVLGGWDNVAKVGFTTLHEYDPSTDIWVQKADMPSERDDFACCSYEGKIYALGGHEESGLNGTVVEYDVATDTWTTKTPMPVSTCYNTASVVNGKIYVIGGYTTSQRIATVQEYDLATDTWTIKSPLPIERAAMTSVVVGDKIYIVNGSDHEHEDNGRCHAYVYDPASSVFVEASNPQCFRLGQNHPNPFNASTIISYRLESSGPVKLIVYDILGRSVKTLIDGTLPAGSHTVTWDASKHASGTYIYRLTVGDQSATRKMLYVK